MSAKGFLATACLALAALWSGGAMAQEATDPPARIGRLADLQGTVWAFDPQEGEWQAVARNRPVSTGDRLATDHGARAEVRIGPNVLRLDGDSEVQVTQLDDDRIRVQLHSGSLAARLDQRDAQSFEVDTDEGRVLPQRDGYYRVDRSDNTTAVTAWTGAARFEASDSALDVTPGQRVEFWRDGPTHYTTSGVSWDGFASWARSRDDNEHATTLRYVSPQMTGWEDLDRNGRWEVTPEYGPTWVPAAVAPGWAPYRYGHWAFMQPWGWTWVDDAPWGFAPFHYGRWVWLRSHWCWTPGTYVARPVYAPALVAWVGGPQVSVSISIGSRPAPPVGWFPLAPHEVYVPSYHVSPTYVRNVNITHVTNVTVINQTIVHPPAQYVNQHVVNAVTVVPADVMVHRRPVAPALMRAADTQSLVQSGVARHAPPVTAPPQSPRASIGGGAVVPPAPGRRWEDARREHGHDDPRPHAVTPASPAEPATLHAAPAEPAIVHPREPAPSPSTPWTGPHHGGVANPMPSAPTSAAEPPSRAVPPPPRGEGGHGGGQHEQHPVPVERSAPAAVPQPVPDGHRQIPKPPPATEEGRRAREAAGAPTPIHPQQPPHASAVPPPHPPERVERAEEHGGSKAREPQQGPQRAEERQGEGRREQQR